MKDKVRVLRIIEYVGDREWVENTLKQNSIPMDGVKEFHSQIILKKIMLLNLL